MSYTNKKLACEQSYMHEHILFHNQFHISKPETRNPTPETLNPKPETRNPKSETRSPKPETLNLGQALTLSPSPCPKPSLQHFKIFLYKPWIF